MKKMQKFVSLMLVLMMLLGTADRGAVASVKLPESLTEIGAEAFAGNTGMDGVLELPTQTNIVGANLFDGSRVYALRLPSSVQTIAAQNQPLAYMLFESKATEISGSLNTCFVFAPEGSAALEWAATNGAEGVPTSQLMIHNGFYYRKTADGLRLLCAVDNTAVPVSVTIPARIGETKVVALSANAFFGCGHVTGINVVGGAVEEEGCFDGAPNAAVTRYEQEPRLQVLTGSVMLVNTQKQLEYVFEGSYTAAVAFASSNENVLTIDENGLMTSHAAGSAVISLSTLAGQVVEHPVSVVDPQNPAFSLLPSIEHADYESVWYGEMPVRLSTSTPLEYISGARDVPYGAVFLDAQGNVVMEEANGGTLHFTLDAQVQECVAKLDPQVWARAYKAGARQVRIVLLAADDALVDAASSAVTFALPDSHPYPIILLEYDTDFTPREGKQYVIEANCLNIEAMQYYRMLVLKDKNGNELSSIAFGLNYPSVKLIWHPPWYWDWANEYEFLLEYPGSDSHESTCVLPITLNISRLNGFVGGAGAWVNVGTTSRIECSYTGSVPKLTAVSADERIATVQVEGASLLVTGVSLGTVNVTVSDGTNTHVLTVNVQKHAPELWLDQTGNGQALGWDGGWELLIHNNIPAHLVNNVGGVVLMWEFLAEDGSVINISRANYNLEGSILEGDVKVRNGHNLPSLYVQGVRWLRATLVPQYNYCNVAQQNTSYTYRMPDPAATGETIYASSESVYAEIGTEAVVDVACLTPAKLGTGSCTVKAHWPDGSVTTVGVLTQANPTLQVKVPYNGQTEQSIMFRYHRGSGVMPSSGTRVYFGTVVLNDLAIPVGTSSTPDAQYPYANTLNPFYTIGDPNIATVDNRTAQVTGVAPGMTTLTVKYGSVVRTATVRVYDPNITQNASLSLAAADDQLVWPWPAEGNGMALQRLWRVKVVADKPVQQLSGKASLFADVTFKDAYGNITDVQELWLQPQFGASNEAVCTNAFFPYAMYQQAAAGAVRAEIKLKKVEAPYTADENSPVIVIPMDSLSNYPNNPMFAITNRPEEAYAGDTLVFTFKTGNPGVNKNYTLVIERQVIPQAKETVASVTINSQQNSEMWLSVPIPQDAAGRDTHITFSYIDPANPYTKITIMEDAYWVRSR